ncbi:gamma-tubulin complex component 3 homolog isoform X1 [Mya arenaria]|uniref:gamma-tubulin complex component 3 homolog isoform X1 n=2 Tax=Mya arenaria TaxID=6604 RepID=UPI0022E38DBA|nr:gamma-tubulin complex component 3 homolog isoform X1 [Mya arenaria]
MSRSHSREGGSSSATPALVKRLCCRVTKLPENEVQPYLQLAYKLLASSSSLPVDNDEFQVSERIRKQLVRRGREKDAATFAELHRKLQTQGLVKNRWAVLHVLKSISESEARHARDKSTSLLFGQGLPAYATSTPFNAAAQRRLMPGPGSHEHHGGTPSIHSIDTTGSSGISSIHGDIRSNDPTPVPQSFLPGTTFASVDGDKTHRHAAMSRLVGAVSRRDTDSSSAVVPRGGRSTVKAQGENTSFEIPETELVRDLVYVFQGIEGKWVHFDPSKDGYKVDAQAGIPKAIRQLVSKLAECGWLFNKVKNYVETRSADKTFGLVGQSFCAALQQELTEYYRLIAVLESQIQDEVDQGIGLATHGSITLRRLVVWTFDPLIRLKTLAALVDVCKGKKGGALASTIYSYMQHGDPFVKSLIKHILTMVSQPIYATLLRWIYDGELEDTHDEFFVAADPTVKNDRLWHDKYSLRKSMIPAYITTDQARRILLTGKSINFLRQVCQDRTPTPGREVAMAFDMSQAEWMFTQDQSNNFQDMIDKVYKETSRHLLDVLHAKYKFMDHLKAMRRYLLLGQGDFIRHLMDLLEEDLAKPASNLYLHNLTGILETAIRGTNAQFDDSDILKRLDVRLLEVSPGDTGWDVFSLDYHVDGPIRTVFTPECMIMYLRVFNFLWRAKRMEYVLALIWKNQIFNSKLLESLPELSRILHQCHILGSEMVHFIQQTQYYISFEVLECSWHELLGKVREAKDLDCVIAAHQVFLDTVITRCLLDEQSRGILTQLRTIFDLIIDFQQAQDAFYETAQHELLARQHYAKLQRQRTSEGDWGITEAMEEEERARRVEFLKTVIPSTRAKMAVLAQSYQDMVQQFLVMVTSHQDVSLRFLSFRLDFNEHYKAREPQLYGTPGNMRAKRLT